MNWPRLLRRRDQSEQLLRETVPPSESSIQPGIAAFWAALTGTVFTPQLTNMIWTADRCIQLCAQNVSTMPLRFNSPFPNSVEPAWLSNPDPAWFENGIADAVFASIDSYYRWGDAFLYVLDYYATGYPSAWTMLDASAVSVDVDKRGRRIYEYANGELERERVVQISRNPRGRLFLRGTSAFKSYAEIMAGAAATTTAGADAIGNTPLSVLRKTQGRLTSEQAREVQAAWVVGGKTRPPGSPAVIPQDFELLGTKLGFSPEELMLVDVQEFDARVLASACGVPPFLLNLALTGGLTYQNPAMLGEYWWRTELHGTCSRFARALTATMLPRGNSVYFDPSHLTQPLTEQGDVDESPAVSASPADAGNVQPLRPILEVTQ